MLAICGNEDSVLFSRVHATLHPAMSVGWSVGRSFGPHFTLSIIFISLSHLKTIRSILSHSKSF